MTVAARIGPAFDRDQAERWLHALFGDEPDGWIDVRGIDEKRGTRREVAETIDEALERMERFAEQRFNTYAGVATRATGDRGPQAGGKENLRSVRALWVDADYGPENPEGDREAFHVQLDSMGRPPSIRVASGGGEHFFYRLEEPTSLAKPEEVARFERTLKGLADYTGGDRAATDASRILRVPGTTNWPDERKRAKGRTPAACILLAEDGPRYELTAFEDFELRGAALAQRAAAVEYERSAWDGDLPETVARLLEHRPKLRARFEGDGSGLRDSSDSGVDWAVAEELAREGVPGAEIEASIRYRRAAVGAKTKHSDYYARTVQKALGAAERYAAERTHSDYTSPEAVLGPGDDDGAEEKQRPPERTDLGNARRLVDRHGADLAFVAGGWRVWDGRRWRVDATLEADRRAHETIEHLLDQAVSMPPGDEKAEAVRFALRSQHDSRIGAVLHLGRAMVAAEPGDFDRDAYLFNVPNGTLDLRTGELRAHRRGDRVTKLAAAEFNPAARSVLWDAFLERVLPNPEVRAFLQRCFGYSLSGLPPEEFVLLLGPGANGKSKMLECLRGAFGDYAVALEASLLLRQRNRPGDELYHFASLDGARLATATETGEGRALAEAAVKKLTGGESIVARRPYGQPFDFLPVAKLMLSTNHPPKIAGTDEGIWRRIVLVPFDVTIPESERDRELGEKLATPEARSAILAWAFDGWSDYQKRGRLDPPDAVRAKVREHRLDQDLLGRFLDAELVVTKSAEDSVTNAELKQTAERWAAEEQLAEHESKRLTVRRVGARLRESGAWAMQTRSARGVHGARLRGSVTK